MAAKPKRAERISITMPRKVRALARAQAKAWRPDERRSVSAWLCELVRKEEPDPEIERCSITIDGLRVDVAVKGAQGSGKTQMLRRISAAVQEAEPRKPFHREDGTPIGGVS